MEKLTTASSVPSKVEDSTIQSTASIEENKDPEEKKVLEQIALKNIEWYPGSLVWQLSVFRKDLKKNKAYQSLHKFINNATQAGLISRQELVSMLPPLLLDVKSTDMIFDMCAAPGKYYRS